MWKAQLILQVKSQCPVGRFSGLSPTAMAFLGVLSYSEVLCAGQDQVPELMSMSHLPVVLTVFSQFAQCSMLCVLHVLLSALCSHSVMAMNKGFQAKCGHEFWLFHQVVEKSWVNLSISLNSSFPHPQNGYKYCWQWTWQSGTGIIQYSHQKNKEATRSMIMHAWNF